MAPVNTVVHRSALLPALSRVLGAVDRSSKIPILTHVHLVIDDEGLTLRGTNLDIEISARVETAELGAPRSLALPAVKLREVVNALPEASEVTFSDGRGRDHISLSAGKSRYSLPFLPGTDFPCMRSTENFAWADMDAELIARGLRRVAHAYDRSEGREYLRGICLHKTRDGDGVDFAATDGLWLAKTTARGDSPSVLPCHDLNKNFPHVVVPGRLAELIAKLLADMKGRCRIAATSNHFAVECDGVEIISKLIDGCFPEYWRMIPEAGKTIVASLPELLGAVRRSCAAMDDGMKDPITLDATDGQMTLQIVGANGIGAQDSVPVEMSDPWSFCAPSGRLLRTLEAMVAIDVELTIAPMGQDNSVLMVRPLGESDDVFLVVYMRPRLHAFGGAA